MGKTVLIADDANFMRKTLATILQKNGYEVIGEVSAGEDVTKKYDQLHPDLVTIDIVMDRMSGITAAEKIKSKYPDANILIVTALGQEMRVREAHKAGARGFIVKPFTEDVVLRAVKDIIG